MRISDQNRIHVSHLPPSGPEESSPLEGENQASPLPKTEIPLSRSAQLFARAPQASVPIAVPKFPEENMATSPRAVEAVELATGGSWREVRVSSKVLEEFRNSYNHEVETAYLLFADKKTGVIEVAIPTTEKGAKGGIGFDRDQVHSLSSGLISW